MRFLVHVMPRPEALDPQGRAVRGALERMGFEIADCRVGKAIIVDVHAPNEEKGFIQVKEMADKLLANPLVETYEVEAL